MCLSLFVLATLIPKEQWSYDICSFVNEEHYKIIQKQLTLGRCGRFDSTVYNTGAHWAQNISYESVGTFVSQ